MKKINALLLIGFLMTGLQAQNYQINFTGSGQSSTVDSVKVLNLQQGTTMTLNKSDVLHLVKITTSMDGLNSLNKLRNWPFKSNK